MTPAAAKMIDLNRPDSAKAAGGELAASGLELVKRLAQPAGVSDHAALEQAVLDRQAIGEAIARIVAYFAPLKGLAHQLHKALCDRERELLAPLEALDYNKRGAITAYKREQDRIREAAEREEAERQRQEQADRAAAEAAQLEAAGDHVLAAEVLTEAIEAPAPIVALPDRMKRVAGLKFRTVWHWRFAGGPNEIKATPPKVIERAMQLLPREYLTVDETKIGAYARAMKSSGRIPGIEIYSTEDPIR